MLQLSVMRSCPEVTQSSFTFTMATMQFPNTILVLYVYHVPESVYFEFALKLLLTKDPKRHEVTASLTQLQTKINESVAKSRLCDVPRRLARSDITLMPSKTLKLQISSIACIVAGLYHDISRRYPLCLVSYSISRPCQYFLGNLAALWQANRNVFSQRVPGSSSW